MIFDFVRELFRRKDLINKIYDKISYTLLISANNQNEKRINMKELLGKCAHFWENAFSKKRESSTISIKKYFCRILFQYLATIQRFQFQFQQIKSRTFYKIYASKIKTFIDLDVARNELKAFFRMLI